MSDDQKNSNAGDSKEKEGGDKLPGPLPGLGGGKPGGGGAPLPGIGGAKPGGGAPLPGVGKPGAKPVVPPFMQQEQQQQQQQPAGPDPETAARDPFAQSNLPPQRPSYMPDEGLIDADPSAKFSETEAGKSRKPLIIGLLVLGIICLGLGYLGGSAVSRRVELNVTIRDALIIQYELKEVKGLFNEVESVVNTALAKAAKRKYDEQHIEFLADKVKGNPVKAQLFTDRNYKRFDAAAVQWLNDYYNKWGELYDMIEEHRRKTRNDEKALSAAREEFEKLLKTNYGVVFTRNEKKGNRLEANVVVLGPTEEDGDKLMVQVQVDTGTYGDARELYNPEGEDAELTKEPERFVVVVGDNSKRGVLKNATQSHFEAYSQRLRAISDLMKQMRDVQTNLMNKVDEICSQDPASFLGGTDPEEALEEYIAKQAEAPVAAPPAEEQ